VSSVREQAERLIELGVDRMAGLPADRLRNLPDSSDALLVVHPDLTPPSRLAPLLRVNDKPGFVVTDMVDVDEFTPIPSVKLPDAPLYLLRDLDRGDAMANWSPDEALPAIIEAGRTPLTLSEGVHWLLQRPDVLARGRCFMTIGSRRRTPPVRWTPGRLPCGSAMAPAATGPPIATRRRSAGAGPATGIPGSGSPRPVADSPSTDDRQRLPLRETQRTESSDERGRSDFATSPLSCVARHGRRVRRRRTAGPFPATPPALRRRRHAQSAGSRIASPE
jgi:hypothetical protein